MARRSRATSTARCARIRSAVSAGSRRWPSSASARASPTTWGSARRSSSSRSCCIGARRGPTTGARRCSCARPRSSATGSARSHASRRRCRSCATTARSARERLRNCRRHRPSAVVLTTYGLLRRDAELLGAVDWSAAALDEAQNIKNAASRTAQAARALRAGYRVALTGTPVENRLAELWSIFEFLNPRLLGPLETFRRDFAVPIERYGRRRCRGAPDAHRPAVHPAPAQERPGGHPGPAGQARDESRLHAHARAGHALPGRGRRGRCAGSSRRRASSAAASCWRCSPRSSRSATTRRTTSARPARSPAARASSRACRDARGGDRRGRPRARLHAVPRDGRPARAAHLERASDAEVLFLHGGVARAARDAMVPRFQEDPHGPRDLRALGQGRRHGPEPDRGEPRLPLRSLVEPGRRGPGDRPRLSYRPAAARCRCTSSSCAGTVEEKVDRLLGAKRDLASRIVGRASSGSPSSTTAACASSSRSRPMPSSPSTRRTATKPTAAKRAPRRGAAARRLRTRRCAHEPWSRWSRVPEAGAQASRRRIAASRCKRIGATWWGRRWIEALERFSSRLLEPARARAHLCARRTRP